MALSGLVKLNYTLLLVSATLTIVSVILLSQQQNQPTFSEQTTVFRTPVTQQKNDIVITNFRSSPAITDYGFKIDPHNGFITNLNDPNCSVDEPAVVNGCGFTFVPARLLANNTAQIETIQNIQIITDLPRGNKIYVDHLDLKTMEKTSLLLTITDRTATTISRELLGRAFRIDDAFYIRLSAPNGPTTISQIIIHY
jgi:hypothetical protein